MADKDQKVSLACGILPLRSLLCKPGILSGILLNWGRS